MRQLGVLLLLVVALTLAACTELPTRLLGCSAEEEQVFTEFRQYDGKQIDPEANSDLGSCAAYFHTPDSPANVLSYYGEQLERHGWTIVRRGNLNAEPSGELITAQRNGFTYRVLYEDYARMPQPPEAEPKGGTQLAVHVSRAS